VRAVRTHGWAGDPPATDDEAVERIVAAARACLDERGAGADLAQVAERLGVTRQTVYRYFPSRRALFETVAAERVDALVDRLAAHLGGTGAPGDPGEAVVEVVLHCVRVLPDDPQLAFIAEPGRGDALIMTADAPRLTAAVLDRLPIDLGRLGPEERAVLAEHMVRLLQSLLLDESTAARDDADLRRFLRACLAHHLHRPTIRG
jgi:AcrR family transcriptional regulator